MVDDGSPDNCPILCDEYAKKDSRVKVIHKENGGLSSARNAGLDIASGEYIGFVDSDDCIETDMYEVLIQTCESTLAEMSMCSHKDIDAFSALCSNGCNSSYGSLFSVVTGQELLYRLVYSINIDYVVVWNKLIRKDVVQQTRFCEGKQHEDEFIMHHLYGACEKIALIDKQLYCYRLHSDSIMHKQILVKRLDAMDAYIDRANYLLEHNSPDLAAHVLRRAVTLLGYLCLRAKNPDAEAAEKLYSIIRKFRQLYRRIPRVYLTSREKFKLLLGLWATPAYIVVMKLRNRV